MAAGVLPAGGDPGHVHGLRYSSVSGSWDPLSNLVVDDVALTVSGDFDRF